jgi:hypothetical protein
VAVVHFLFIPAQAGNQEPIAEEMRDLVARQRAVWIEVARESKIQVA